MTLRELFINPPATTTPLRTVPVVFTVQTEQFRIVREFVDVETAERPGRTGFDEMVKFLKRSSSVRVLLVEKTDRLYRNLKDYVTMDELDLEIHFVRKSVG